MQAPLTVRTVAVGKREMQLYVRWSVAGRSHYFGVEFHTSTLCIHGRVTCIVLLCVIFLLAHTGWRALAAVKAAFLLVFLLVLDLVVLCSIILPFAIYAFPPAFVVNVAFIVLLLLVFSPLLL